MNGKVSIFENIIYSCPPVSVVMFVFSVGICCSCSHEFTKLFAGVYVLQAHLHF